MAIGLGLGLLSMVKNDPTWWICPKSQPLLRLWNSSQSALWAHYVLFLKNHQFWPKATKFDWHMYDAKTYKHASCCYYHALALQLPLAAIFRDRARKDVKDPTVIAVWFFFKLCICHFEPKFDPLNMLKNSPDLAHTSGLAKKFYEV